MSNSVQPHRQQPTRLCRSWDSPGKNTGVGCHFLLQFRKVKSESEIAQLCLTLCNPMNCSLPGSSVHGIFQARVLEWVAIAFSGSRATFWLFPGFPNMWVSPSHLIINSSEKGTSCLIAAFPGPHLSTWYAGVNEWSPPRTGLHHRVLLRHNQEPVVNGFSGSAQ